MDHYISIYQARHTTSIVASYMDTATVKTSTNFYKNDFPSDMILTDEDATIIDEQVEKLTR